MPEFVCEQCGKREFHENEDTLQMMIKIHGEFCRKKEGESEKGPSANKVKRVE